MEILQIVILIIGAIIFTVSFFIPDKQVNTKDLRDKEEQVIRELIDKELGSVRQRIDEATEDSIERAKDTTERQMDRITNEKMMAINEYSDTVMTEIHKNHEEAVFLYDMLNNKHAQVKSTAAELNQTIKLSKQTQNALKSKAEKKEEAKAAAAENASALGAADASAEALQQHFEALTKEELGKEASVKKGAAAPVGKENKKAKSEKKEAAADVGAVEVMFASDGNEANNNDRILKLHKEGKSNMAIARELGLGIGEVKLVIDLFEGGM